MHPKKRFQNSQNIFSCEISEKPQKKIKIWNRKRYNYYKVFAKIFEKKNHKITKKIRDFRRSQDITLGRVKFNPPIKSAEKVSYLGNKNKIRIKF